MPEDSKSDSQPSADFLLEIFLGLAESGIGASVTLLVDGVVVAGTLMSAPDFMKRLGEDFSDALVSKAGLTEEDAAPIRNQLTSAAEELQSQIQQRKETTEPFERTYVQLQNAVLFTPNGPIRPRSWRGRLSAVDGWFFGSPDI